MQWDWVAHLERRTLNVPEAAKVLGISRNAAYEAARKGQIPTIRIGKRILVPITALERLLSGMESTADNSSPSADRRAGITRQ